MFAFFERKKCSFHLAAASAVRAGASWRPLCVVFFCPESRHWLQQRRHSRGGTRGSQRPTLMGHALQKRSAFHSCCIVPLEIRTQGVKCKRDLRGRASCVRSPGGRWASGLAVTCGFVPFLLYGWRMAGRGNKTHRLNIQSGVVAYCHWPLCHAFCLPASRVVGG